MTSGDAFLSGIGAACQRYEQALLAANRIDCAHLQRFAHDLLDDPAAGNIVSPGFRYVLVDEYQDTNHVQEQLLLKLAAPDDNLCVVGDEDQSLYRFRGATVRNILEFPQRVPSCTAVALTTNDRSHRAIVERLDHWMASADWSNPNGTSFRHDKTVTADPMGRHSDYPAVIGIWGRHRRDEVERFAELVAFLMQTGTIADYSQVALLLHSVREDHSGPYLGALATKGIPAFCPRARAFFEMPEIRQLVACYAVLFGWYGNGRGETRGAVENLARYVDNALIDLGRRFGAPHPLAETQVLGYFRQNQDEMRRIVETEVDVSLEKDDYILAGKVDLLLGGDGKLELLDFKTSPRPKSCPALIAACERQLCTYAHILEQRHGRRVDRLLLYWTSEPRKEDALMALPYRPERVTEAEAGRHFDETVRRIQEGMFTVTRPPEAAICRECDLRAPCRAEGIIGASGGSA